LPHALASVPLAPRVERSVVVLGMRAQPACRAPPHSFPREQRSCELSGQELPQNNQGGLMKAEALRKLTVCESRFLHSLYAGLTLAAERFRPLCCQIRC